MDERLAKKVGHIAMAMKPLLAMILSFVIHGASTYSIMLAPLASAKTLA